MLVRSSTSNRQDTKTRGFTGLLGVFATLRESLLPVGEKLLPVHRREAHWLAVRSPC